MAKNQKGVDLGVLQNDVEQTSRVLKGARSAFANAKQAVEKAEEAYANAQKALNAGVEQLKAATKIN